MGALKFSPSEIIEGGKWHDLPTKGKIYLEFKKIAATGTKVGRMIAQQDTALLIRDKRFSWSGSMDICDGHTGNIVYKCKGKHFTWGQQLQMYDATETHKLMYIKEKKLTLFKTFDIFARR
eukprot:TRINITY_DN22851_c0_g1_i1.p1 TRINITY_DN22851_c0_g1~~TRINITY_DN22851_c0_g1_i1.p1  ORF type:complete len:134 (+),score=15.90 TRINITY_DN22851_c0_g1_i1:42-404(+)